LIGFGIPEEVQDRRTNKDRCGQEKPLPENVKTMMSDNSKVVTDGKGLACETEIYAFRY